MAEIELLAGERQKGESYKAVQACNDFLRLGPGRSLVKLYEFYTEKRTKTEKNIQKPPTNSLKTIQGWSGKYNWAKRAESFDETFEEEKTEVYRDVVQETIASKYKRIEELIALYEEIRGEVKHPIIVDGVVMTHPTTKDPLYYIDTKVVAQVRGTLDDLAKEVGERIAKSALVNKDGDDVIPLVTSITVRTTQKHGDEENDNE